MANEQWETHVGPGLRNDSPAGNIPAYWRNWFSGKRVCIVGNSPDIDIPHPSIDEHDIVIRFNDCVRGGPWGKKTSFYCTTLRREVRTNPEDFRVEGIPLVYTGSQPYGNDALTWEFAGHDLARGLGCWPSSGLMAAYIACASGAAHVTLAAMRFAYPLVREPSWGPRYAPPWIYHNFLGERRVLAGLLRTFEGSIELPQALGALRSGAFNRSNPCWWSLASALQSVSQVGQEWFVQIDIGQDKLSPYVQKLFNEVAEELAGQEPSMEGVRQLEPFFYLSTDRNLHPQRWFLFRPEGARQMDDLLARLRTLQTYNLLV